MLVCTQCSMACMWRSEGNLWEVILFSHSVDLGNEWSLVLNLAAGVYCQLPPAPHSAFFNLTVSKLQPPGGFPPHLSRANLCLGTFAQTLSVWCASPLSLA